MYVSCVVVILSPGCDAGSVLGLDDEDPPPDEGRRLKNACDWIGS
jgi:hypothetical protein